MGCWPVEGIGSVIPCAHWHLIMCSQELEIILHVTCSIKIVKYSLFHELYWHNGRVHRGKQYWQCNQNKNTRKKIAFIMQLFIVTIFIWVKFTLGAVSSTGHCDFSIHHFFFSSSRTPSSLNWRMLSVNLSLKTCRQQLNWCQLRA